MATAVIDRPPEGGPDAALDGTRRLRTVQSAAMFGLVVAAIVALIVLSGVGASVYGVLAVGYLAVKLVLAAAYRPARGDPPRPGTVAAVVPFYNEDPETLAACLRSLLAQSSPIDRIYAVDDGSTDEDCLITALGLLSDSGVGGAIVTRLERNRGKRHAQAWAFERIQADFVLTVDSDTVLDPNAVREALRGFGDPAVQAVTGNVRVRNESTNLLTRLTSIRYANAFLWERAAYSSVGSVLCACGSFSIWRRSLIEAHLDDYVNQTYLGIPVMYGDDRRLTNYALTRGKVLLQDTAIAYTTVPERLGHFAHQQLRWNKSFFRETLWALRAFRPGSRVWLLSLAEIALWLCFTLAMIIALVVFPLVTGALPSAWYLAFVVAMAYARSLRYLGSQPTSLLRQIRIYSLAPIYGFLYLLILMPIRIWALVSLRNPGWGTRRTIEVRWAPPVGRCETRPGKAGRARRDPTRARAERA